MCVVPDKRRKLEISLRNVRRRRRVPYLDSSPDCGGEMTARGRKGKSGDLIAEREVIQGYPARDVGENGAAIFVDGEEEVSARVQCEAGDISAMGKRKGIRFRTVSGVRAVKSRFVYGGAYLTRSKTVTRLPTGDNRQVPSGVNSRLPLL